MSQGAEVRLENFFIFNPGLSRSEGEEEKKILYYHPHNVEKDVQLKNSGLCEALIKFAASFGPDKPCQVFCTEKTKQFFYEPEPNFWMAMTLAVDDGNVNEKKSPDPSDAIQENIGHAVLKLCYKMFFLFSSSFESIMDKNYVNGLRDALMEFFEMYLLKLNLANFNILDVFQGMQYLPLAREPFLHVQSFLNTVETKFPSVRHSAFLYNDHLVWSGIDPNDMQILYQYLVRTLLPSHLDLELQGGSLPGGSPVSAVHYGSFVTCPEDLMGQLASSTKVPKIYLHCDAGIQCFHLIVYRALSATLCLFLPESTALSLNLYKNLEHQIGPRLTTLVAEISEHCVRSGAQAAPDSTAKFIYFNKLNLAIKSSMLETRKGGPQTLPQDIMKLLANLKADSALSCDSGEIVIKTEHDSWIVVKYSNSREFYTILPKKSNLRDVSSEVKKICNTQLKGIFFLT